MGLVMLVFALAGSTLLMAGAQTEDPEKRKKRFIAGIVLLAVTLGLLLSQ